MIKLKAKTEPYWLELGSGVKVKVKPCNSAIFYEAKAFMNNKVTDMVQKIKETQDNGIKDDTLPDLSSPTKREAYADQQLILGLALAGILEWDGVLEAEIEEKAPLTPEKIEELFTNFWLIAENFRHQYCGIQEILEAEKNVSTPEPGGTSVTGETTAKTADSRNSSAHSTSANTQKQL